MGVIINGVKWATRNIGFTGKFVSNSENYGELYQWNTNNSDYFLSEEVYYKSDFSTATTWLPANDPSPRGWRVPTDKELKTLLNTAKVKQEWTSLNDVFGMRFTDIATGNSIFLPAAGYIDYHGSLTGVDFTGYYWSNIEAVIDPIYLSNAYLLIFNRSGANWGNFPKGCGMAIRSVAE